MTVYFLGILLYSWNHRTKIVWQRIWIFSRIKLSLKYADSDSLYIFIYFRIVVWVFRAIVIVHASDLYFITVTRIRRHDTHTIGDKGHWLSALRYIYLRTIEVASTTFCIEDTSALHYAVLFILWRYHRTFLCHSVYARFL